MADQSKIEWTDATWNPISGCSIVSPGCINCYAMKQAHDLERRFGSKKYGGLTKTVNGNPVWTGEVRLHEGAIYSPLGWRKPRRIFVNSMSDLFHEDIPDVAINEIFAVMALCPQHTFQVLTKRAERMQQWFADVDRADHVGLAMLTLVERIPYGHRCVPWPLPNVWLGVSCERQQEANARIPLLLQTPAAIRFVSAEPMLDGFDLSIGAENWPGRPKLDWLIIGGESGPKARPFHLEWAHALISQSRALNIACFVKQMGSCPTFAGYPMHYRSRKGGDWDEWPQDLRVREFPTPHRPAVTVDPIRERSALLNQI